MTRTRKHPDRPPHRRKATATDRTKNSRAFQITGSWDAHPDRPTVIVTQDRRAAKRLARDMAARGGYVIVEEHIEHGRWRTLYELDGPALLAERRAAEQAAAEEAERAHRAAERGRPAPPSPPRRRGQRARPRADDPARHRPARTPPAGPPRHRGTAMTAPAPAALAVVRAALADAEQDDEPPEQTARRIVAELAAAGWSITAADVEAAA